MVKIILHVVCSSVIYDQYLSGTQVLYCFHCYASNIEPHVSVQRIQHIHSESNKKEFMSLDKKCWTLIWSQGFSITGCSISDLHGGKAMIEPHWVGCSVLHRKEINGKLNKKDINLLIKHYKMKYNMKHAGSTYFQYNDEAKLLSGSKNF